MVTVAKYNVGNCLFTPMVFFLFHLTLAWHGSSLPLGEKYLSQRQCALSLEVDKLRDRYSSLS